MTKKAKLKLFDWDSAEHLKTEADIAAYLNAVMEEGEDPAFLAHALGVVARARDTNQRARETNMSRHGGES